MKIYREVLLTTHRGIVREMNAFVNFRVRFSVLSVTFAESIVKYNEYGRDYSTGKSVS